MKKSWLVFLGLLLLAAPMAVQAQYTVTNNPDNTLSILRYTGPGGTVTVPPTIGGSNVTIVGEFAFANISSLTNVIMPDAGFVASIESYAFYLSTNLTNVSIPASVTNIGSNVFADCHSLVSITVDPGNSFYSSSSGALFDKVQTSLLQFPEAYAGSFIIPGTVNNIGDYAFSFCQGLTGVTIPASVTNLGAYAFDYCTNLTSVTVGNGVTNLGADAFFNCTALASVTIGSGATNIGAAAFAGCTNLAAITVDPANSFYASSNGVLFNKSMTALLQCPEALTGSYSIPAGVTTIESNAFEYCLLTNLTIPNTVTSIGDYAFAQSSLTSVTINSGVTSIGTNAFYECYGLTNVMIPASVTNLADYAFEGCTSLKSVDFQGNAPVADATVFYGDSATAYFLPHTLGWGTNFAGLPTMLELAGSLQVTIEPNGAATNGAQWQVDEGSSQNSGATVTNLAVGNHTVSFSAINGWTTPPNQIVSISAGSTTDVTGTYTVIVLGPFIFTTNADNTVTLAQYSATNTIVTIPTTNMDGLTVADIGVKAFLGSGVTSVTIPAGVTNIEEEAFANCSGLTNITIPNAVINIADGAFSNCTSLPNVTIPASVTNIGDYAFNQCTALQWLDFHGNAPGADTTVFNGEAPTNYYLPAATNWSNSFAGVPAALWNPQFQTNAAGFGVTNNYFGFNITGTNNFTVLVEASTNLTTPVWITLTNVTLTNGSFLFSDPQTATYPGRFYILQMP
jgi:hypothetical protein